MGKKMYISLPITGRSLPDVMAEAAAMADKARLFGYEPVNPLEVSTDDNATYAQHMGNDIAALLECDAILLSPLWEASKGCRLEKAAADIYGIKKFM